MRSSQAVRVTYTPICYAADRTGWIGVQGAGLDSRPWRARYDE
ncbi:MAG: hypothetical protein Kow00120_20790 [Anaerolineae bacterium]